MAFANVRNVFPSLLSTGTPLTVNVDANNGHFVSAFGSGLVQGGCGQQLEFFVTGTTSKTS